MKEGAPIVVRLGAISINSNDPFELVLYCLLSSFKTDVPFEFTLS